MADVIGEITGQQMLSGVFPDLPQRQPPFFARARNVLFSDNSVQPIPGQYILSAAVGGKAIRGLRSIRSGDTPQLFFGSDDTLYKYTISGGTTAVGTGYTGAGNAWVLQRWGTWVLGTNYVDPPQVFKGTSFEALTGLGSVFSRCKILLPYKDFMLAFSTDLDDSQISWCHRGDVEQWTASTTNTARTLNIRDTTSGFNAAIIKDERIYVTSLKSLSVMSFISSPFYFSYDPITSEVGTFGPLALTSAAGNLYGIGPNGCWTSDGSSYLYVDEGVVHDFIFDNINLDYAYKALAWHDSFTKHVWFWFPEAGQTENSLAVGLNYKNRNWTIRADPRSAALESGDFKWSILADPQGNVYAQSLVDAPVSAQDAELGLEGSGTFSVPFGQSGFGQIPLGGTGDFTE